MTNQISPSNDHNLFSLDKVGNVSLVVDAPCIISGASAVPHASRNQGQLDLKSAYLPIGLGKVSLNQWAEPSTVNFLPNKVSIKRQIPEVLVVGRYQLECICVFLLHPSYATLAGSCQIVTIGEIVPIFEVFFDIVCHLLRFSVES